MHFIKQVSCVLALGLAIVDSRVLGGEGKRALSARDVPDAGKLNLGPQLVNRGTDEKLNVRQIDIPDILPDDDDDVISTAESCRAALNRLRKLRKAKLRKRQIDEDDDEDDDEEDEEDEDEDDEDDEDDGMMLGPDSITVDQDGSLFITWADGETQGASRLGTYGLNSCTAVLITGTNGGIVAHISPIEEDGVEDDFKQAITDKVLNLYNDNVADLAAATMWVYTPETADAEDRLLSEAAAGLKIAYKSFRYAVVDEVDDEWVDSQVGTAWVDFSDPAALKVFFGNVLRT